jgi:hypothetical protein
MSANTDSAMQPLRDREANGSKRSRVRTRRHCLRCDVAPSRPAIAVLLALIATTVSAGARSEELSPRTARLWADFGFGVSSLNLASAPGGDNSAAVVVDLTIGGRVGERWLLGFNLAGAGSQISNANYNPNDYYSDVYGQGITNVFAAVQYEPHIDHGWTLGLGAGQILYHNHNLETLSRNVRSGQGTGAQVRIGYDWPRSSHNHVEARLSVESGRVNLSAPFTGSFHMTAIGLTVHISHH